MIYSFCITKSIVNVYSFLCWNCARIHGCQTWLLTKVVKILPDQVNVILLKFLKSQFEVVNSSHKLNWGKQKIISIKNFGECLQLKNYKFYYLSTILEIFIQKTNSNIWLCIGLGLDFPIITDEKHNVVVYFSNVSI